MVMITSSFAGILSFGGVDFSQAVSPSQLPNGDIIVGVDYEVSYWEINGRHHMMDGNLTIRKGGVVTIENGGLSFTQDTGPDGIPGTSDDRVYTLTVEDGGMLIVRNSTITTHLDQIYDYPALGVIIRNGAFVEFNNSILKFPGHLVVDDSTFIMRNSTIMGHSASEISAFCDPDYFPAEAFDDAPIILFVSSDVYLYDSFIEDIFEGAVNETAIYNQTYPFAIEDGERNQVTYNLSRNPALLGAGNNCIGEDLVNLTMDDALFFTVAPGETLGIDSIDTGGLLFDETEATIRLFVKYKTDPGYAGTNAFLWGFENGGMVSSGIVPHDTAEVYNTTINNEVVESAVLPPMDQGDLGQLNITFTNDDPTKNVYINRVWVTVEFSLNTYRNLTLAGTTDLTAVNTFIAVDFSTANDTHNVFNIIDQSNAYLYGVYVDTDEGTTVERHPAYVCSESTAIVRPLQKGQNDTTGEAIGSLSHNDSNYYVISDGEVMEIDKWNVSGLEGDIVDAKLWVSYRTSPGYTGSDYIQYAKDGSPYQNTSIVIQSNTTGITSFFNLNVAEINLIDISTINIKLNNTGGAAIELDAIWIELTFSPTAYIYRWASVEVVDSQDLPVKDATIEATLSPNGEPAYYPVPGGIQYVPPDEVLDYLGKDETTFNITDASGRALIPLLTEYVNQASMPNSRVIGSYDLNIRYTNISMVEFFATASPNFDKVYPAIGEEDQMVEVYVQLEELILDKPDLIVSAIEFDTDPIYDYQTVVVIATISNIGITAAVEFKVSFVDFFSGESVELGNQTINTLDSGDSVDISISWATPESGVHTITVVADLNDTVIEEDEGNNQLSRQVNVLARLPDLSISSGDINFNIQPAFTDSPVIIQATILNTLGKANANNVTVKFYAGNPDAGGVEIGSTMVNVPMGGSNTTSLEWIPSQIGEYPIYVRVNPFHNPEEYNYSNNEAYRNITVELSLNPLDIVVNNTDVIEIQATTFNQLGNIVVMDDGTLIVNQTVLNIQQSRNNEFQILVMDNGTLILVNSTLTSSLALRVYLFDNATMIVDPSTIESTITIQMEDNSILIVDESQMQCDIISPTGSNARLIATNTTFTRTWSGFGGNAIAYLTGVTIPALSPQENAEIYHYRWLQVEVLDGTGFRLPGAYLELQFYLNHTRYANAISNSSGMALFQCLADKITSSSHEFYGNYRLNATYWYQGQRFDTDSYTAVSFSPYKSPLIRSDKKITVEIRDALPDLDPPFYVSDTNPAREQEVILTANVSNTGVVPAYNVIVRFKDNDTVIDDVMVNTINPGETVSVTTIWTACYPLGYHNLSVIIDPFDLIPEMNKSNNMNYTWVYVRGIVELVIAPEDISIIPSSITVNNSASVIVMVRNTGDVSATDVNVTLYDKPPNGVETFVGYRIINEIGVNDSGQTTFIWMPTIPGDHILTVRVDEINQIEELSDTNNEVSINLHVNNYADLVPTEIIFSPSTQVEVGEILEIEVEIKNQGETKASGVFVRFWLGPVATGELIDETYINEIAPGLTELAVGNWVANTTYYQKYEDRTISVQVNSDHHVSEINYDNNEIDGTITVVDIRPDLLFVSGLRITHDGEEVNNASFGETVNIIADAKNNGLTSAMGVTIKVFAVDNESQITYISTLTEDFLPEETITLNISWSVNATVGFNLIYIELNPDFTLEERLYSNNNVSLIFDVGPPEPIINIDLGGIVKYRSDSQVVVRGVVKNAINNQPLPNIELVITLRDPTGVQIGESRIVTTSSTGYYETAIYIPPGIEGNYLIEVTSNIPGTTAKEDQSIYVEAPFSETSVPWWVWIIIVVVVVGIIVGFSIYLYKYGLGKLVECGECGALIPENSKKCPKCGVEFETGTAKCSECGAWIPASATVCPECGVKFVGEAIGEEEDEYIKRMREQYEAFLDVKREQAKQELGKKYSDSKFLAWWKKQPDYITFEDWLTKEEERRKSGAFPCPICGTLNPKGATICHKCGTVFETVKPETKEEPKRKPIRRIVRRAIGKKAEEESKEASEDKSKEEKESEETAPSENSEEME